jgi:hypothetical protein
VSTDTTSVLDSIDGALRDFETSTDAMRWVPEGERLAAVMPDAPPGPWIPLDGATWIAPVPASVPVFVDVAEFSRSVNALAEAVNRALRPVFEDTARQFHALSAALYPQRHRRCGTCHPSRKPKPLAVDGHEYQRRLRARRRRKRRTRM